MFCKRMAAIHHKGRDHLETLREAHRAESERLLGVLGDVLLAVREAAGDGQGDTPGDDAKGAAGRLVLKALDRAGGVEALSAAHEAVAANHGNNYLPLLDQRPGPGGEMTTVTVAIDVDAFAPVGWRKILWRKILRDKDRPGMLVRRHLEVCVFSCLAAEPRSGDIAVAGSDSYANLHDQRCDRLPVPARRPAGRPLVQCPPHRDPEMVLIRRSSDSSHVAVPAAG